MIEKIPRPRVPEKHAGTAAGVITTAIFAALDWLTDLPPAPPELVGSAVVIASWAVGWLRAWWRKRTHYR